MPPLRRAHSSAQLDQPGADAAAAVVRVDRGLPAPAPVDLAGGDQGLALEHPDAVGREVEARPLPVALDVLQLDRDLPGVMLLGGGEERVCRLRVSHREGAVGEAIWE